EVQAESNTVIVGTRDELERKGLVTGAVNWLVSEPPPAGTRCDVRIRSHHVPAAATLDPQPDGTAEVRFDVPQSAVTPGQLAVFYAGDRVLGGAPAYPARRCSLLPCRRWRRRALREVLRDPRALAILEAHAGAHLGHQRAQFLLHPGRCVLGLREELL